MLACFLTGFHIAQGCPWSLYTANNDFVLLILLPLLSAVITGMATTPELCSAGGLTQAFMYDTYEPTEIHTSPFPILEKMSNKLYLMIFVRMVRLCVRNLGKASGPYKEQIKMFLNEVAGDMAKSIYCSSRGLEVSS